MPSYMMKFGINCEMSMSSNSIERCMPSWLNMSIFKFAPHSKI